MKYRREIDGLRAIAVVPVMFFHAGFESFAGGFIGVDVFFVISGYLITTLILSELEAGQFTLVRFYERRARRILPALFLVVLASMPLAWLWLLPTDLKDFFKSVVAVSVFLSNHLFLRDTGYFATASELKPLLHTWSLAVEEQYYLLYPLLLLAVARFGRRITMAATALMLGASLVAAQIGITTAPKETFFLLYARGWELLLGALLANYHLMGGDFGRRGNFTELGGATGLFFIAASVFVFDKATPFPGLYALLPTVGTALLLQFATADTWMGRILSWRPLVGIGLISYGAYLWHQPLFAFWRHERAAQPAVWEMLTLIAVAFLLAYLSWRFVETPFRRRDVVPRRWVFASAALGSLLLLGVGVYGNIRQGFPERMPPAVQGIYAYTLERNPRRHDCVITDFAGSLPIEKCRTVPSEKSDVLLWGDSHANAMAAELEAAAQQRGTKVTQLLRTNCVPVTSTTRDAAGNPSDCSRFNDAVLEHLKSEDGERTVVLVARWTGQLDTTPFDNGEGGVEPKGADPALRPVGWSGGPVDARHQAVANRIRTFVEELLRLGKQVVLVYQIPEAGWNVPGKMIRYVLSHDTVEIPPEVASTSSEVNRRRNKQSNAVFDGIPDHPGLLRIRADQLLCDTIVPGRCITHCKGIPLYSDDDHPSSQGARWISRRILDAIESSTPQQDVDRGRSGKACD